MGIVDHVWIRRRLSVYGVRYWTTQRIVESTIVNYGATVAGTWALNSLYQVFGAKIGSFTIIRSKAPGVSMPDMLKLGKR